VNQMETDLVFVYGTLRMYEENDVLLKKSKLISRQCWTKGVLADTGLGYPAIIKEYEGESDESITDPYVYGELYKVSPDVLEKLDELEGYYDSGGNNLYDRIIQTVYSDIGTFKAYVYIWADQNVKEFPLIPLGDWKYKHLNQKEQILYFAYGSCMDAYRFKLCKVDDLFQDVIGRGLLLGYSFRFTRKAHDGGRADIVECKNSLVGKVEGKVYRICHDALDYLHVREGVVNGIYRPTFVDLVVDNEIKRDVLTFVVIDKQEETKPPQWYVEELLRGAKECGSDSYYKWLERYVNDGWNEKNANNLNP
jgi:gamma-glutamylcyclotransferase (GGCT)/AIG2-like uncharacterized protein YtfP/cation transport regulator ChaC